MATHNHHGVRPSSWRSSARGRIVERGGGCVGNKGKAGRWLVYMWNGLSGVRTAMRRGMMCIVLVDKPIMSFADVYCA
jgi:hypothetical protein